MAPDPDPARRGGIKGIASSLLNPALGGGLGATIGFVVESDLAFGRMHIDIDS